MIWLTIPQVPGPRWKVIIWYAAACKLNKIMYFTAAYLHVRSHPPLLSFICTRQREREREKLKCSWCYTELRWCMLLNKPWNSAATARAYCTRLLPQRDIAEDLTKPHTYTEHTHLHVHTPHPVHITNTVHTHTSSCHDQGMFLGHDQDIINFSYQTR